MHTDRIYYVVCRYCYNATRVLHGHQLPDAMLGVFNFQHFKRANVICLCSDSSLIFYDGKSINSVKVLPGVMQVFFIGKVYEPWLHLCSRYGTMF